MSPTHLARSVRFARLPVAFASALCLSVFSQPARADVSSWFSASGGMTWLDQANTKQVNPGTLQLELGVGSAPDKPFILGGVTKTLTLFGQGTDLAFAARFASGGFVRGNWGVAADLGMYQRWWGNNSTGFMGAVVLGAPWGFQLTALTEQGSDSVHSYGAVLGIDLLRLTVYRTSSEQFWPNPFPAARVGANP